MQISESLRYTLEMALGVIYMIGAGFLFAYTLKHGEEFYNSFANSTWFAPASWFIQKFVLPNPRIFTVTLILFQTFVGMALLSQGGYVGLGLLAGMAFCMYAALFPTCRAPSQIWRGDRGQHERSNVSQSSAPLYLMARQNCVPSRKRHGRSSGQRDDGTDTYSIHRHLDRSDHIR